MHLLSLKVAAGFLHVDVLVLKVVAGFLHVDV
jgi:hypothetical protein